jgi:6-pyruvoyltetrahydropterin/6-carboxytetrahydropterin synthase
MYYSTKTFGNDRGLSCAFRQWRATHSHCQLIHGYSLGFKFVFKAETLDDKNWVYDFGNTKWIKEYLDHTFDHTVAIAEDDPLLEAFEELEREGGCDLRIMQGVGCEKFAEIVFHDIAPRVQEETGGRVWLKSVEVFEHGSNSAIYES